MKTLLRMDYTDNSLRRIIERKNEMSYAKMSREDAQAMVDKLKSENVRSAEIRRRMVDEGFSFAEIYAMLGERQFPNGTSNAYSNARRGQSYNNNIEKNRKKGLWSNISFTNKVGKSISAIIVGIIGFIMVVSSSDAPVWAICAFPLISLLGFIRLWMILER